MNKLSITLSSIALLFSASTSVYAFEAPNLFAGIQYKYLSAAGDNKVDSNAYELKIGGNILKELSVDLRNEFAEYSDTDMTSNMLEVGLTPSYQFDGYPVGVFGRGALGNSWMGNNETFGYGSIEVGGFYRPWDGNSTKATLSYRYRNAFDSDMWKDVFQSNSVILGGEYSFTNNHSIVGSYEYMSREESMDSNVFSIGYLGRF